LFENGCKGKKNMEGERGMIGKFFGDVADYCLRNLIEI